jgi:pilus assembly protein TadC
MATAVLVAAWVAYLGAWVPVSVFVVWALAALAVAVLAWTARFALFVTRRLSRAGRRWR